MLSSNASLLKTYLHRHDSEVAGLAPQTPKQCVHSNSKSAAKLPCVQAIGLEYEQVVCVSGSVVVEFNIQNITQL